MNEQKKIMFNKSSLFNLKAELLKKQEEVKEKKRLPQHKVENFEPSPAKPKENQKALKEHKKSLKDNLQAVDTEELEAYKKSKAKLEKKAELYEHLSNPIGKSELEGQFLVDFDSKKQQETNTETSVIEEEQETLVDDDNEWTEFTDCLGRTRKCLKTDLELYQQKDSELLKRIDNAQDTAGDGDNIQAEAHEKPEKPLLVQTTNDYLQTLRDKWEQKERELLAKQKDIHYQDLLFDEARQHGVGYYAFSTDEVERTRQMEELLSRREETLLAQARAEAERQQRDDLMAARLKAARARQRLRAGLPLEDPEEAKKEFNTYLLEFLNNQKEQADARAEEEKRKIKEQVEKERQKMREAYVREWDRGKQGVEDKVKPFKEMSQEEYVEQQRDKRIKEFAPMQSTSSHKAYTFDDRGNKIATEAPVQPKTWSEVRPKVKTPPPPDISDLIAEQEQKGLYFSTKKKAQPSLKYKNFVKQQESVPIENELSDDDTEHIQTKRKLEIDHAEIAPPPTYDYYGPVLKHFRPQTPFHSDMREAYAQGTKSLETKPSTRHLPPKYDFSLE